MIGLSSAVKIDLGSRSRKADHVLGRPSTKFRKIQVFAVVSFWSLYLLRYVSQWLEGEKSLRFISSGHNHGPPVLRNISATLSRKFTAWQSLVITLLWLYIARNFAKIVGLESPEPLANLYNRAYFRATWVTTALDAGFWTAMKIRRKWLRDFASMVFSVYYLIAAEQADEKVRKVRGLLTVDHLRVSWNKSTTPYLSFITRVMRPKLTRYPPRALRIPRPAESSYKDPVNAWLYFDGTLSALRTHTKIVLDISGGGFVAMNPRHHDDKLLAWSGKTGLPILSLDYKKAPEYPYPYALNECYDVYHTLIATLGRCVGLAGNASPRVVLTGDSAGANFATGLCLMILQTASLDQRLQDNEALPVPEGLILIYPSLDMNIGNWMSDDQMSLIQDQRMRKTNKDILRRKSQDYYQLTPQTPKPSDDEDSFFPSPNRGPEDDKPRPPVKPPVQVQNEIELLSEQNVARQTTSLASTKPKVLKTRLAVSSMISYFGDRVLTPELMRSMIILYVGPHNRPDFSTDFLLSPVLAPEALLAKFPKTYFLTGERDPLVDDTVILAGRIRQAKHNDFIQRQELGLIKAKDDFREKDHVEVTLIPGISHGFMQFVSVFPEGWKHIFRCGRWIEELFDANDHPPRDHTRSGSQSFESAHGRHHRRVPTESSGDEDRPLEMSSSTVKENGHAQPRSMRGRGRRVRRRADDSSRSMVSLASEEDLLGRRMKGLTVGLMGMSLDGTQTP